MRSYLMKAGTATGGALGSAMPVVAESDLTGSLTTMLPLIIEVLIVVVLLRMVVQVMKNAGGR